MSEISVKQQAHDLAVAMVGKIVTDPTNATEVKEAYLELYKSYIAVLSNADDSDFGVQA